MSKRILQLISCLMLIVLVGVLSGCGGESTSTKQAGGDKNIKLGTLITLQPFMEYVKGELDKKGYNVEIVLFDANNMPAVATRDGSINGYIHNNLPWVQTFNKENGGKLEMVKPYLFYYRTCLYSSKYKSIDEFPDGIQIAIPDDPTNKQNSLLFLQRLNLLKLGEKHDAFYGILDIIDNPKHIQFFETEITTTARSYPDAGAVICNSIRAKQAGVDPNSYIADDVAMKEFPVGLTVNEKDKDAQWVKDTQSVLQSEAARAKFNELFTGDLVLYDLNK